MILRGSAEWGWCCLVHWTASTAGVGGERAGSADPIGDRGLSPAPFRFPAASWCNLDEGISVGSQCLCAEETGWRGGRSWMVFKQMDFQGWAWFNPSWRELVLIEGGVGAGWEQTAPLNPLAGKERTRWHETFNYARDSLIEVGNGWCLFPLIKV